MYAAVDSESAIEPDDQQVQRTVHGRGTDAPKRARPRADSPRKRNHPAALQHGAGWPVLRRELAPHPVDGKAAWGQASKVRLKPADDVITS